PEVAGVGANVHLMGIASTPAGASASFVAVGVEPDREEAMGFAAKVRAGKGLPPAAPAEGEDQVLLARGLATTLRVEPGGSVTLLVFTPDGSLNAVDARVSGTFTSGVQDLDSRL